VVYPRLSAFVIDYRAPLYHRGPRMERNFRLEAQVFGTTEVDAKRAFVARAASGRMVNRPTSAPNRSCALRAAVPKLSNQAAPARARAASRRKAVSEGLQA
jgi:hypothetical protein